MEQYRVYLRAELSKLRNVHDGQKFLGTVDCRRESFDVPRDVDVLAERFATQELVDAFVHGLGDQALMDLTACCGLWRITKSSPHPVYAVCSPNERIEYRWCLARSEPGRPGDYRIFDGMHRAIQMLRNRDTHIPLCVVEDGGFRESTQRPWRAPLMVSASRAFVEGGR